MFLTKYNKPNLYPIGANLDDLFEKLLESSFKETNINKYPATDIYTKDNITYIDIAITGFNEDDIEITLDGDMLIINGYNEVKEEKEDITYHTRNIARRSFVRKFTISDSIEDIKANIKNGILHLELIPKEKEETKKQIKIEKK